MVAFNIKAAMNFVELLAHWLILFPPGLFLTCIVLFAIAAFISIKTSRTATVILCAYLAYILFTEPSQVEIDFWQARYHDIFPFADYTSRFPIVGKADKEPCIYALHPHGLLTSTLFVHTNSPNSFLFDSSIAVHSALLKIPLVREIFLAWGCIPARKGVLKNTLQKGKSIVLIPGGTGEIFNSRFGATTEQWNLTKHKGFLKLAAEHKIPVVPIYIENEQDLLSYKWTIPFIDDIGTLLSGMTTGIGAMLQGCLPHNVKRWWDVSLQETPVTTTHIGNPFHVTGSDQEAHANYLAHVRALFDSVHKGTKTLEIL